MSKLETKLASKFLNARKSNRLLSFLSITSVLGVMMGVATLILVVSVLDGFTENLKSKFLGLSPHVLVTHTDGSSIHEWDKLTVAIEGLSNVVSATPMILGEAMILTESVKGVVVRGIVPELEMKNNNLSNAMVGGQLSGLNSPKEGNLPGILLGKELLYDLGATIGSEITLASPIVSRSAFGMVPKMKKFQVTGYFDSGIYEHNQTLAYINLNDAQEFFMLKDSVNSIAVITKNYNKSDETAQSISKAVRHIQDTNNDAGYWARDWLSMNITLFEALKLEQYAMFVILTLIILVASFNIVSMITITVKDKRKEIAIIRAMGGSTKLIQKIFTRQGLTIGILGTVAGNLLALIVGFILATYPIIRIPAEIYHSETIPILLAPKTFILVTICAVVIVYVASIIPSRATAKQDPIEAIRND